MRLEDTTKIGREKNRQSRKRRAIRKLRSDEISTSGLKVVISSLCEEYGVPFNSLWRGKEWGCARNFIDYCVSAGKKPQKVLMQAIARWPRIKEGAVAHPATGRPIRVSKSFDFEQFFKFMAPILDWVEHGSSATKVKMSEVKTIDLRKREV